MSMPKQQSMIPAAVEWREDHILLLDQRKLPQEVTYERLYTIVEVHDAIRSMKVRGAPAIAMAAAYGLALSAVTHAHTSDTDNFWTLFSRDALFVRQARPTAVNLMWAVDRILAVAEVLWRETGESTQVAQKITEEAHAIVQEDVQANQLIGQWALSLLQPERGVLTHCNAGWLATARYGTATAPLYRARELGQEVRVFATETRPFLQGARLTAYELMQAGIDVTLITDSMAGIVMAKRLVQAVIVGADRVAKNGDTANKVGTYSLAVLAKAHGIPFYVAAPWSTVDLHTPDGTYIPIEERATEEVTVWQGQRIAPVGVAVYHPAFDVTPHEYIDAIVTERGIIRAPYTENFMSLA